jgi:acyl-CoA thioesterase-1
MKFRVFALIVIWGLLQSGCSSKPSEEKPGPSGPTATAPAPSKSVPKIIAFGDSLTAGYGLPPSESYPALLQKKIDSDGYQYQVVNAGVSGDTTAGGLRRIDWTLGSDAGDVKIVILGLGGNDVLRGLPAANIKKNLSEIITRSKAKGAQVLLAGMEAPTNAGPEYRRDVRNLYRELAAEHPVQFIPFILEGVGGVPHLNQRDGIHPTAEGARIMSETVYRALKPML